MERIEVTQSTRSFKVGYQDENDVTVIAFDISDFQNEFGEGSVELVIAANGTGDIYPVPVVVNDTWAEWTVKREQIPDDGGRCQLSYLVADTQEKKSQIYGFTAKPSLGPGTGDVPPYDNWLEIVLEAKAEAIAAANAAQSHADDAAASANDSQSHADDAAASAELAKGYSEDAKNILGVKQNWATVRLDKVVEITNIDSLRTYFYNLRKSESRNYQVEISPGNNQNIIDALGGFPEGVTPTDKFFIYFTLPYSEAGGFIIDIALEGRNTSVWYTRKMWGTLDSAWQDSGWQSGESVTKEYVDGKLVTIDVEVRGENNFWTDPVTTGQEIIDMVNAGKEVRLHFFDTITNTGDQLYAYETTDKGVPYFRRNVVSPDEVSRINIGVQFNGEVKFTDIPYKPPVMAVSAVCENAAAPVTSEPCDWYVPKTMPKPSGKTGMMVDVFWKNGRVDGIGYNASLVWGAPGEVGNEVIINRASVTDSLTGEYNIPAEGTVRYQLIQNGDTLHWKYVSGKLLGKQFSTTAEADVADKPVHGMQLAYLPGMEIYLQMDKGNAADVMRLVPDEGATLPVYGLGNKTGVIPAGYILHLKNAGAHWQIVNAPPIKDATVSDKTLWSSYQTVNALAPTATASGPIATLNGCIKDFPLHVVSTITPSGGGGTPDAPIPIVGYDSCTVTHNETKTYTQPFGKTVYGGSYDWQSGVLTETYEGYDFHGLESEGWYEQYGVFRVKVKQNTPNHAFPGDKLTSWLPYIYDSDGTGWYVEDGLITVGRAEVAKFNGDISKWKEHLKGHPLQVAYPTVSPVDTQLTPTEMLSLEGTNNAFSDTGDTAATGKQSIDFALSEIKTAIVSLGTV